MTNCAGDNTIAALLAGAVDATAVERLELHLDRCPSCRELVARLGRGLSAVGGRTGASMPQIGERIGRYEVRRVVGVGGMGVVYEAHDTTLDRRVAVKLLRPDLHDTSLLAEAQAMARLQHANIVGVFDVGIANGQVYVCMEYVAGTTLRTWAAGRSWREIAAVYAAAGEGLAYVHRAGLVHLDFKPDNVLVDRDGRVRVTDFGLARMLDAPAQRGLLAGTLAYMPPEQRRCEATDARSDQYAFCASMKEALGGRGPAWLHRVLARGMAADRADRFDSMTALLAALTPRPRRIGRLAVIAATAAAAFALTMQPPSRARTTMIVERPFVIDRVMPAPAAIDDEPPTAVEVPAAPSNSAHPSSMAPTIQRTTTFAAARRRSVAPAFAMLAHAITRPPLTRVTDSPSISTDGGGFATELGPCDDGSLRTCSYVMPSCPDDAVVAVQEGCWTCADAETCEPRELPTTYVATTKPATKPHHHPTGAGSNAAGSGSGSGSSGSNGSGAGSGFGSAGGTGSGE